MDCFISCMDIWNLIPLNITSTIQADLSAISPRSSFWLCSSPVTFFSFSFHSYCTLFISPRGQIRKNGTFAVCHLFTLGFGNSSQHGKIVESKIIKSIQFWLVTANSWYFWLFSPLFMWFPRLVQRSEILSEKLNMMSFICSCVGRLTVPNGKKLFDFVWRQQDTSFPESLGCLWVSQNEDLMNLLCSLSFRLHSNSNFLPLYVFYIEIVFPTPPTKI